MGWGAHSKSMLVTYPPLKQLRNSSLFLNPNPPAIAGLLQLNKVKVQKMQNILFSGLSTHKRGPKGSHSPRARLVPASSIYPPCPIPTTARSPLCNKVGNAKSTEDRLMFLGWHSVGLPGERGDREATLCPSGPRPLGCLLARPSRPG